MYQCPSCGGMFRDFLEQRTNSYRRRNKETQMHHIIPKKFGGGDEVDNLIKLCSRCHASLHVFYGTVAMQNSYSKDKFFFRNLLISFLKQRQEK